MGQAQKIMVNEITSGWWPVSSGVPQECILQCIFFLSPISMLFMKTFNVYYVSLQVTLKWEDLLTVSRSESPCRVSATSQRAGQSPIMRKCHILYLGTLVKPTN